MPATETRDAPSFPVAGSPTRRVFRWLVAVVADCTGVLALLRWRRARRRAVVVLRYHRLRPDAAADPLGLSVTPRSFERQMSLLRRHYRVRDALDVLGRDAGDVAGPSVVVTFDDGYADNHDHALPVLAAAGLPATIYVTTGWIGTRERPWWDEMEALVATTRAVSLRLTIGGRPVDLPLDTPGRRLAALTRIEDEANGVLDEERRALLDDVRRQLASASGGDGRLMMTREELLRTAGVLSLGAHGVTHRLLPRIAPEDAEAEVREGRRQLEEVTGLPVRSFAYPAGQSTPAIRELVRRAGFELAFGTDAGENGSLSDPFDLRRRAIHERLTLGPLGRHSDAMFVAAVEGLLERPRRQRQKIRVLYVIDKMGRAGAQRHLVEALGLLDRTVFEPAVVCLESRGVLGDEVVRLGIPLAVLGVGSWAGVGAIAGVLALGRRIREFRPDIVHCYLFTASVVVPPLARLARVPVVLTARRDLGEWRGVRHVLLNRAANVFTDAVLANSSEVVDVTVRAERVPRERVRLIHNGIGPRPDCRADPGWRERLGVSREAFLVGSLFNIRPVKDPMTLLEAFRIVADARSDARLVVGGRVRDEALGARMEEFLDEHGLRGRVYLPGRVDDTEPFLDALDVYVSSSRAEGFSNSILEAMRAGLPVVATAVGGALDQVEPGKTGLLVPVGDPAACAAALLELAADEGRRRRIGESGRRRQRELFSGEGMRSRTEALYAGLALSSVRGLPPALAERLGSMKEAVPNADR